VQKTYALTINQVEVSGRLIVLNLVGNQTEEMAKNTRQVMDELLAEFFGPKQILVNLSHMGRPTQSAYREAGQFLRGHSFKCIAIYGAKPAVIPIVNKLIRLSGTATQVKLFPDEASARAWLKC
jgi:hypothetical protein